MPLQNCLCCTKLHLSWLGWASPSCHGHHPGGDISYPSAGQRSWTVGLCPFSLPVSLRLCLSIGFFQRRQEEGRDLTNKQPHQGGKGGERVELGTSLSLWGCLAVRSQVPKVRGDQRPGGVLPPTAVSRGGSPTASRVPSLTPQLKVCRALSGLTSTGFEGWRRSKSLPSGSSFVKWA